MANSHCELGNKSDAAVALDQVAAINPLMNAQLYAENMYLMAGSKEAAEPFIAGFRKCEFIE